jgi:hypothetical protein
MLPSSPALFAAFGASLGGFPCGFDGQAATRDEARSALAPENKIGGGSGGGGADNVCKTDDSLHTHLGLHFPSSGGRESVPAVPAHENAPLHGLRFPQCVVGLLNRLQPKSTNQKALEVGCAVGGSSFELAKT